MMTTDQINTEEFERGVRAARKYFRVAKPNRNTIVERFHFLDDEQFAEFLNGELDRASYLLGMASVFEDRI